MESRYSEDTFAGTTIPCKAMARSFKNGSCVQLLEKALKDVDPIAKEIVGSIETIAQAEKAYGKTEDRAEKDAILIKWIMLCRTEQELADPMMRSPAQSRPEAVALQTTMKIKLGVHLQGFQLECIF